MSISEEKTALFFRLSISITVFSALFKFIPSPMIVLGTLGMVVFLSIQVYQKKKKEALDYARLLLILSFATTYTFSIFSIPYIPVMTFITKLTLLTFLVLYIKKILPAFQDIMQNHSILLSSIGREQLSFILAELAIVYVVMASLFTILNWQIGIVSGNLLLLIGLFSAIVSILASSKTLRA